ncbi:MAG: hypothetical protein QN133_12920 [Armatimonadota bacterium]|nr:hypothetical protein [Armatimonadota bacterium]
MTRFDLASLLWEALYEARAAVRSSRSGPALRAARYVAEALILLGEPEGEVFRALGAWKEVRDEAELE